MHGFLGVAGGEVYGDWAVWVLGSDFVCVGSEAVLSGDGYFQFLVEVGEGCESVLVLGPAFVAGEVVLVLVLAGWAGVFGFVFGFHFVCFLLVGGAGAVPAALCAVLRALQRPTYTHTSVWAWEAFRGRSVAFGGGCGFGVGDGLADFGVLFGCRGDASGLSRVAGRAAGADEAVRAASDDPRLGVGALGVAGRGPVGAVQGDDGRGELVEASACCDGCGAHVDQRPVGDFGEGGTDAGLGPVAAEGVDEAGQAGHPCGWGAGGSDGLNHSGFLSDLRVSISACNVA